MLDYNISFDYLHKAENYFKIVNALRDEFTDSFIAKEAITVIQIATECYLSSILEGKYNRPLDQIYKNIKGAKLIPHNAAKIYSDIYPGNESPMAGLPKFSGRLKYDLAEMFTDYNNLRYPKKNESYAKMVDINQVKYDYKILCEVREIANNFIKINEREILDNLIKETNKEEFCYE